MKQRVKLRTRGIPKRVLEHLLDRVIERKITEEELIAFWDWIKSEPMVPLGNWYHRIGRLTVCGRGDLVLTFFHEGAAEGEEI